MMPHFVAEYTTRKMAGKEFGKWSEQRRLKFKNGNYLLS